jgi:creatinine amidohydrolase
MKPLLRELAGRLAPSPLRGEGRGEGPRGHVFLCNWYNAVNDIWTELFQEPEDHAGEMETSFMLYSHPQLVAKTESGALAADSGATAKTRFEAINRGWISITRPWHLLTTNSGSGNPHHAAPEKAEKMMKHLVDRLGGFLYELATAKLDDRFPY